MGEPFYQDDLVTIYHSDCREHPGVLAQADVMVTDPPYGYGYASNARGAAAWKGDAIANDQDVSARDDILDAWGERPALVFGSWKRPRPAATRELLIWHKVGLGGMGDLSIPWKPMAEEIYVLGSGFEGRRTTNVLDFANVGTVAMGREHPNEKPVPLMRELIGKCPPGTIIDPFMGSGSTLVAAQQLGRRCIGFDVEEKWCRVARDRVAAMPLFHEDGPL